MRTLALFPSLRWIIPLALLVAPCPLLGQDVDPAPEDQAREEKAAGGETAGTIERRSKSGLEVPTFGGPNSVGQELEDQARSKEYRFRMLQNLLEPWFDWKQRVHEKHGFTLGFNATLLGQYGDGSIGDRDVAGGGIYRLQGAWTAVGRETGHPGTLSFRFEYRSSIGPSYSPASVPDSSAVGSTSLPTSIPIRTRASPRGFSIEPSLSTRRSRHRVWEPWVPESKDSSPTTFGSGRWPTMPTR
jgi:hypothetical protein